MSARELHSSIMALVSLSAGLAGKHPGIGLWQLDKPRAMGLTTTEKNASCCP